MVFYHDLIVQKSWDLLQQLRKKYDFILIGGWAVFLYTKALKSKDIDLVLEFAELAKLKQEVDVLKNERLQKYEAKKGEVEIDIYLPYYSRPGLPAEDLKKFTVNLEGFKTLVPEALAVLKQQALLERAASLKGRKDLLDLISLLQLADFDWQKHQQIINQYSRETDWREIKAMIQKTRRLEEINLNPYQMSRLKKKILLD